MFPLPSFSTSARHTIAHSLRFRASNGAFLSRTVVTPSLAARCTVSLWVKRGSLATGGFQTLYGGASSSGQADTLGFGSIGAAGDQLELRDSGAGTFHLRTNALFRDPSAHGHVVVRIDTAHATPSERVKLYWNGQQLTSLSAASYPAQNYVFDWQSAGRSVALGQRFPGFGGWYYDGLISEFIHVDGQALAPEGFGRVDPATGAWVPRRYTGTYGANGFHLPFNDAASTTTIGQDRSGNANNWTSSGISVTSGATFDQMLDTPTSNFATISSIDRSSVGTQSWANLRWASTNSGAGLNGNGGRATIGMTTGKWYAEYRTNDTSGSHYPGIANEAHNVGQFLGATANSWSLAVNGGNRTTNNSGVAYASYTWVAGDVFMIAFDADARSIWWGRNGVWFASGDPATGANPAYIGIAGNAFFFAHGFSDNTGTGSTIDWNFGQRAFAYTPPTGFVALNTSNLPTPTIRRGDDGFYAGLRTGTGAPASVTGLRFEPSLFWVKSRGAATNHNLFDTARGTYQGLVSNSDNNEYSDSFALSGTSGDGCTLGSDANARGVNINAHAYVDWAWRRSAAFGFDVVTYVGNGVAGRTVAHGLNAVPHMMIVKCRNGGWTWRVYHRGAGASPQNGDLRLSQTGAFNVSSAIWNNTAPGQSSFTVGTDPSVNSDGNSFVAYLWTSIPGFSRFGSYTGNGSADGPFVWCGFRPRFLLVKRIDGGATNWHMRDGARSPFNLVQEVLSPNVSDAEVVTSGESFDLVANGFKLRSASSETNASGFNYVFAAFAETPFKFATAR